MDVVDTLRRALAGRYTIERELGAGGMATVYLAEDLKHHRKVALKVLRPELSALLGAERFLKEIELTASLQHPHLLPLFDSGEAEGLLFYVMPHVEGESLRERLTREKQLGVEEAVRLTTQVASALDYAHRRGVLHRDIKPENILLEEGQALIADFGIALALRRAGGNRLTETGLSLGTPQYMSPEQATGDRELDARSDIYSLACVLYEMLAGEPPHTGPTVQAVVAKLLTAPVTSILDLRSTVPVHVAAALEKALSKLPADRFTSAAQFADALAGQDRSLVLTATRVTGPAVQRRARTGRIVGATVLVAALAAAAYFAGARGRGGRLEYDVGLPDSASLAFTKNNSVGMPALAVEPRGGFVIYVADRGGTSELWYRSLAGLDAHPLPGTDGAFGPFLSPDGGWVAFFSGDKLKKVPVAGGDATTLTTINLPKGGVWPSADRILVSDDGELSWVDPSSGSRSRLRADCDFPSVAGQESVALCSRMGTIWAVSLVGSGDSTYRYPTARTAPDSASAAPAFYGTDPRLLDGRYLLFTSVEGGLRATRFDLRTLRFGRVVSVQADVRREGYSGSGEYGVTASGDLVYALGDNAEVGRLVRWRGAGAVDTLPIPPVAAQRFDLTPDGRRLAVAVQGTNGQDLLIFDLASGQSRHLFTTWNVGELRWDPSGSRVLFEASAGPGRRPVLLRGSPNSSAPPDTILNANFVPSHYVAEDLVLGSNSGDIVIADLAVSPARLDTLSRPGVQYFPALSTDREWLAYYDENTDIVLEPYPRTGVRYKVAAGLEPIWGGPRELVFRSGTAWYTVQVTGAGDPPFERPRFWFDDRRFINTMYRSHVLAPDRSVIYLQGRGQSGAPYIRVIPGWVARMKRAVDAANR